jgi:lactoylglutathione lyase
MMILEHVAIWTRQLELLREFYITHFNGVSNEKYINSSKGFESYFISFESGARLELMYRPDVPESLNASSISQYLGLTHLAFAVGTMAEVDQKAGEMHSAGFPILSGPRKTGDGYYEFETLDPDGNRLEVSALFV